MRLFLLLCLLLAGLLAADLMRLWQAPLSARDSQLIQVERGLSYGQLVEGWAGQGWLHRPRDLYWLKLFGRLDARATSLKAGEYELRPGMTPLALLQNIHEGDVYLHRWTLVEGWTYAQLRRQLAGVEALNHQTTGMSSAELMSALGRPGLQPEGRFLPETYRFLRGSSDIELLRRAADAMDQALQTAWQERSEGLPLTSPEEGLVLASIIEKETAQPAERTRIAGVFIRRLQRGMRLQTDPTVIYGLGEAFDGNLRRRDLRADTPYNTYTRAGLPPTPIAMPGRASLEAAFNPAPGDALYFVSRGDGSHVFSASLEAHERAVDRYQR